MTRPSRPGRGLRRPRFLAVDARSLVRHATAAVVVTMLGFGVASSVSLSSSAHRAGSVEHSTAATAPISPSDPANLPAAFERRSEAVSRDAARPGLSGTSDPFGAAGPNEAADPNGTADLNEASDPNATDASAPAHESAAQQRAARLGEQRSRAAHARSEAAIAARAQELAHEATNTSKAAKAKAAAQHRHVFPLTSYRIAATFGEVGVWARYHTGIDFSAPVGTPIHAAAAGVVTHAGPGGGAGGWAGSYVTIEHEGGYQTLYAHMNPAIAVSVGTTVAAGQLIGHVGLTGRTFGAHCHFELYPPGVKPGDVYAAIDPMPWLKENNNS